MSDNNQITANTIYRKACALAAEKNLLEAAAIGPRVEGGHKITIWLSEKPCADCTPVTEVGDLCSHTTLRLGLAEGPTPNNL